MNIKQIEKGFYYHYKHTDISINNYAYEVIGIGHFTEESLKEEDKFMVIYRPLYESFIYKNGKMFDVRPLNMFLENVKKGDDEFKRFSKINDEKIIFELEKIRDEMYK